MGQTFYPKMKVVCGWLLLSLLLALGLAACGDEKPTATPPPAPTATPAAPPPLAYLAVTDFNFADQAERALRTLVAARPDFPAYATWTVSNRWYLLARDNDPSRLKDKAGKDARIFPVNYIGETAASGQSGSFAAYSLELNRAALDVKAGGTKEAARLLFNRAVSQLGVRSGLLIFTTGEDQIYTLLPANLPPERVLPLASLGKLELVSAGSKNLAEGAIVATSASPALGDLKLTDATEYTTLADNRDIAALKAVPSAVSAPALNLQLRSGSKLYDYSRANVGKYTALVFDRQVLTSAQIAGAIRDRAEIQVPRWAGAGGQADMQRFVDLINANPPQLFEARELNRSPAFVFSGAFTR